MTLAEVRFYDVVLFVHIAAVVVGFGPSFAYGIFQVVAERHFPRALPAVIRGISRTDQYLLIPGMFVVLIAGVYLVVDGPFGWDELFVNVGLTGTIVLLVLGFAYFRRIEKKLIELSERDIAAAGDGEVTLSDEYTAASKSVARVGTLAAVIVLVVLFFMTVKP